MDDQITLRIPRDLARALARRARARGVPKSQVVREALLGYLTAANAEPEPGETWRRIAHFMGSLQLDHGAIEDDPLARQIRDHNWRE